MRSNILRSNSVQLQYVFAPLNVARLSIQVFLQFYANFTLTFVLGIMEKLKRLQEGADLDDLLAEMDEELPSDEEDEEDEEDAYLTEVQKKVSIRGP